MQADCPFTFARPIWLDELDSTNDYVKALDKASPLPPGTVVAARRQLRGKGRHGNVWHSRKDGDLTFSFLWRGTLGLGEAGTLPMACGLAVTDYIRLLSPTSRPCCKWPNDVLVDDAKMCGILTEGGTMGEGTLALVIGIGLNLANDPDRDVLLGGRPTSSVEALIGRRPEPEEALPGLLRCLEERITGWQSGGFAAIRQDVEDRLWGVGRQVTTTTGSGRLTGVLYGLGGNGEALLRGPAGIISVSSVSAMEYNA